MFLIKEFQSLILNRITYQSVSPHDPDNASDNDLFCFSDTQAEVRIGFLIGIFRLENELVFLAIDADTLDHHPFIGDARRVEFIGDKGSILFDSNHRAVRNQRLHAVSIHQDGKISLAQIAGRCVDREERSQLGNVDGRASSGNVIDGKLLQIFSLDFLRWGMA